MCTQLPNIFGKLGYSWKTCAVCLWYQMSIRPSMKMVTDGGSWTSNKACCICNRQRSHTLGSKMQCLSLIQHWATRGQYLALSKGWHSCYPYISLWCWCGWWNDITFVCSQQGYLCAVLSLEQGLTFLLPLPVVILVLMVERHYFCL